MAAVGCDEDSPGGGMGDEVGDPDADTPPEPGAEASCEGEGACAEGGLCDVYDCGGAAARFNHFGCPRIPCERDDDCPSDEACFVLAFDRTCEASRTDCYETDDGACTCAGTDDCSGVVDAHCLPTEFYPPAGYCDPSAWSCDELPAWIAALNLAAEPRVGTPLGDALEACSTEASAAAVACP